MNILLSVFIIIPLLTGIFLFMLPKKLNIIKTILFILAVSANCFYSVYFYGKEILFNSTFLFHLDLYFRYYDFSSFMILILAVFALLSAVYTIAFMQKDNKVFIFYAFMLIALSLVNGVLLSDNFIVFLLFWEALMIPMFAMIAIGKNQAYLTAIKTFIISSVADLCLMFGVMLICAVGGSFVISQINVNIEQTLALLAFVMLFIGAAAKAGAMPFHSWIIDASVKAPLPFMVFIVTVVEKILSIYLLIRIVKDIFVITPGSPISIAAMIFGVITLLVANMLAVYQKDFKKMLSYASIGQAGYMIVAVASVTVFGMVAAVFHMFAHIVYKSGLFFVAGNIEKTEGTTEADGIKSNLRQSMPYTFLSFILSASAFAGIPFFFAFFSKEMIYESALSVNLLFYICLTIGSFLSAIAIINWGRILFFNKPKEKVITNKEIPLCMFLPAIFVSCLCLLLGIFHYVPQYMITSIIGKVEIHTNIFLTAVSGIVLLLAVFNNLYTNKVNGRGLGTAISFLDFLKIDKINSCSKFDPYEIFIKIVKMFGRLTSVIDKALNYFYDIIIPKITNLISLLVRKLHNGNISVYILWVILSIIIVLIFF